MNGLPPRFMSKVRKSTNGCWHWTGHIDDWGYGHFGTKVDGRASSTTAHRYAYELIHGPLPPKGEPGHLQVDHECHNRSRSCKGGPTCLHRRCVNPAHLAAKTPRANSESSQHTTASVNAAKTHCIRGHELTGSNLRVRDGKRWCHACHLARNREARKKRLRAERGEGWERRYWQREVTHCPQGHPYSGDNLRITNNGQRQCRSCLRGAQARYRARQREAH
jgi:hypothetical protein